METLSALLTDPCCVLLLGAVGIGAIASVVTRLTARTDRASDWAIDDVESRAQSTDLTGAVASHDARQDNA